MTEPTHRLGKWSTQLTANGAFDAEAAYGYLQRHAIPGVDEMDVGTRRLTRLLSVADGMVPIDLALRENGVLLTLSEAHAENARAVIGKVRRWFDLDADLDAVDEVLDRDPVLATIGHSHPGLRVTGYPDAFEGAIATVLGQQVSLAAARTFAGRLAAAYGTPGPRGLTLFPTPERLAAAPVQVLRDAVGVPNGRARTLRALAELFAGGFRLEPVQPPAGHRLADARATLLAVPGIGTWTVEYLAMRALHDPDACPAGDLVLRRALGFERTADAAALAEAWRPYRAYAVVRLWTGALAGLPTRPDLHRR